MPELVVDFITSLDGYASADGWPGWCWRRVWSTGSAWVLFPVITGATGRERIYDGDPDVVLDMVDSRTFHGRIQLVEYVPRVLHGAPGVS